MHMTSVGVAPRGLQLHDFITQRTKAQPQDRKRDVSGTEISTQCVVELVETASWNKAYFIYIFMYVCKVVFLCDSFLTLGRSKR